MTEPARPDPGTALDPVARRRHTRRLVLISASTYVLIAVLHIADQRRVTGHTDPTDLVVRLGITGAAMVLATLGMLELRRRGVSWLQPPPDLRMSTAERRAASRALRPGGTVTPEHRDSTLEVARYLGRYRWAPWFFLALSGLSGWLTVTEPSPDRWWYVLSTPLFLGMAGYYVYALRKARAIVDEG
ncbi:MAG TPA: hypothetical protein VGH99_13320 [Pseudonocardia sp.]|jgi:hypothetical protein